LQTLTFCPSFVLCYALSLSRLVINSASQTTTTNKNKSFKLFNFSLSSFESEMGSLCSHAMASNNLITILPPTKAFRLFTPSISTLSSFFRTPQLYLNTRWGSMVLFLTRRWNERKKTHKSGGEKKLIFNSQLITFVYRLFKKSPSRFTIQLSTPSQAPLLFTLDKAAVPCHFFCVSPLALFSGLFCHARFIHVAQCLENNFSLTFSAFTAL
jgi:hypothetical protein